MTVNEIVQFLNDKPGYSKEGAKRLANKVFKGQASVENCKEALSRIKNPAVEFLIKFEEPYVQHMDDVLESKLNNKPIKERFENTSSNLKLKSRWQGANGKWLESYKADETSKDKLSKEDIESAIKDALKGVQSFGSLVDLGKVNKNISMVVWTADKHIGADTTDAQHDKPYNKNIFRNRMLRLSGKIMEVSKINNGLDTLVVADLGDATDGQDGYTASRTHRLPQNMTNKEVFETYFQVHVDFLETLIKNNIAQNYEFWFNTCSNHGGSYEYACHRAFQIYIQTKYPDIKVKSFDKFIGHTEFNGVTYLLTHGKDDTNRKYGLPLYPDAKTEVFIDNYLKLNKLSFNKNIRLIKGDLHQSCSAPCKNINRYRNVASMFGSSGWVMDNYGYTPAGTDYEILDNTTGEILEGTFWYE
jgi:hypothetical protein